MKSCGIIAEYNPFHNGHAYQIEQAKKESQADVIVVVMSGHFLQRGEPAILNKWQRTELALKQGADIVIELPFAYAVQAADYFAKGGVKLLQSLGVDALSFGTDITSELDYQKFAYFQLSSQEKIDETFKTLKNNGMSYPQQMTEVYRLLYPEMTLDFSSPNHILGMAYAKENVKYPSPMTLYPVARNTSSHHDEKINHDIFASGTAIREAAKIEEWTQVEAVVSKESLTFLQNNPLIDWENFWPLIKYQLTVQEVATLQNIYQMTQGIEYRLKEMAKKATSFNQFVSLVKSKRFTWTRIQRLCTYLLLQVTQEEIEATWDNSYLRILGFTDRGQKYLKQQKKQTGLPIITNINKQNERMLSLDIKAGKIYQQINPQSEELDYYRHPVFFKKEGGE